MGNNHKNCDCCCTPGIRRELERLIGRQVVIRNNSPFIVTFFVTNGRLVSVDCDIARVEGFSGLASIPICEIKWLAEMPETAGNNPAFVEALG